MEGLRKVIDQSHRVVLTVRFGFLQIALRLVDRLPSTVGDSDAVEQSRQRLAESHHTAIVDEAAEQALGKRALHEVGLEVEHAVIQAHEWLELPRSKA